MAETYVVDAIYHIQYNVSDQQEAGLMFPCIYILQRMYMQDVNVRKPTMPKYVDILDTL